MKIQELPTPALLLDQEIFELNLLRMAAFAAGAGKSLRPHAKAHKCVEIARRQVAAGAVGVCVATVNEAELMTKAGIRGVLLTSPLADCRKFARMAALATVAPDIAVVLDHPEQVRLCAQAAEDAGVRLNVLVDLDVGDHRTGIAPGEPARELARAIVSQPSLVFQGLQGYSIRAAHLAGAEGAAYTAMAMEGAHETRSLLESDGVDARLITGGSTGSYQADAAIPYMTELQAGSYALMDLQYARMGIDFGHALTVLATVVSANHPDRVTVDAGLKAFATDRTFGPDVLDVPGATYAFAGDEFGYVSLNSDRVRLGERVRFIPPHCDPTVNLYDRIHVCNGEDVVEVWPVMDRYAC